MWWSQLGVFRQVMFVVAVATTAFLIIQIIMMFIGMGTDADFDSPGDVDADLDGGDTFSGGSVADAGGLQIFSLKSILAFLGIGGWTIFGLAEVMSWWAATLIGVAAGAAAAVAVAFLMRALYKLKSNGNIDINNCVGLSGETYLTIPAGREGAGKVNVVVQEKLTEFTAVTDCETPVKTGSAVKVVGIFNGNTLIVEPFMKEKKEEIKEEKQ